MSDERLDNLSFGSGNRLRSFQEIGLYRVNNIILVSTLYDSFILAEDGRLSEVMLTEFLDLDLHHTPRLQRVSTGTEALALARDESRYNLIITSPHVGDMSAEELRRNCKSRPEDVGDRLGLRHERPGQFCSSVCTVNGQ